MILINDIPFWDDDNPPVQPGAVQEVEQALGVALPISYVNLLRECNGGSTNRFRSLSWTAQEPDDVGPIVYSMWCILPEIDDDAPEMSLLDMIEIQEEWELPEGIIFFSGGPSHGLFLDYRGREEAGVGFYCADLKQDVLISESFDSWLGSLVHQPL